MAGKLTADEIEYGGKPIAGKAWSEEARAAALAARRRGTGTGKPSDPVRQAVDNTNRAHNAVRNAEANRTAGKKPGVGQSTSTHDQVLSAHSTARNLSLQFDQSPGSRSAASTRASMASSRAFAASNSTEGAYGGVNISSAARDAHTAAATAHEVAASGARVAGVGNMSNVILSRRHDALATVHKRVAKEIDIQLAQNKKPITKSKSARTPLIGDCMTWAAANKAGPVLLVVDAGVDHVHGAWIAVRHNKPGIPGMSQKREVVKPEQVVFI